VSFNRFDQAKPFFTLGIIVFAWLLLPVAVKSFLRVAFFELQAPVQVTASYVRDLQEFWAERTHSKDELIEAARELRHVYAGYEFQAQQTDAEQAEITRLERLLRLPADPHFRFEPARVCRRDLSGWWQQLTIRKGSNYDLPVGAPVVYGGGVVGRVREVRAYEADVDLVSSPRLRIAATFENDTRPVSYQGGNNPPLAPAHGLVEFVPPDIVVYSSAPRRLVTSGLGEFPAGLTIGYVSHLETSPDGLFQAGEISLDPRLTELTEVTVLVPLQTD
jgi:rod shape-determining protein MreC